MTDRKSSAVTRAWPLACKAACDLASGTSTLGRFAPAVAGRRVGSNAPLASCGPLALDHRENGAAELLRRHFEFVEDFVERQVVAIESSRHEDDAVDGVSRDPRFFPAEIVGPSMITKSKLPTIPSKRTADWRRSSRATIRSSAASSGTTYRLP